jgi:hypothetical protein
MTKVAKRVGIQSAALLFKIAPDGLYVLLLSSRQARRWVIPQRWPIRGVKPRDVAARAAYEQGGVAGRIVGKHAIGTYHYSKPLPGGSAILRQVKVYLFAVDHETSERAEEAPRKRQWVEPEKAAQMMREGGLAANPRRLSYGLAARVAAREAPNLAALKVRCSLRLQLHLKQFPE